MAVGAPGLLGSIHLGLASLGAGPAPVNELLRTTFAGSVITRAAIIIGTSLLLYSWLALGYDVVVAQQFGIGTLCWLLAMWTVPLVATPALFSRDMYSYFAQGHLADNGWDPYVIGVGALQGWFQDGADPVWARTPSPYGSLFLLIERWVFQLSNGSVVIGVVLFRLISLTGLALLILAIIALARMSQVSATSALWLAALNPLVVMDVASAGHNDTLMVAAIVAAFVLGNRWWLAGVTLVAVAAAIKPVALLALPFVALVQEGMHVGVPRRLRLWLVALMWSSLVLIAITQAIGFGWGWIAALSAPTQTHTLLSLPTLAGLGLEWLLPTSVDLVTQFRLGAVVLAAVGVIVLAVHRSHRSPARTAAIAFLIVVLLSPAGHSWYLLWFIPLFAATGTSGRTLKLIVPLVMVVMLVSVASEVATTDTYVSIDDAVAIGASVLAMSVVVLVQAKTFSAMRVIGN